MDNIYIDVFYFWTPYRILWANWEKFMGAQDYPGDSIDFTVPLLGSSGNSFTGYISADGAAWTQVGAAQTIPMGTGVYLGLCLTSHDNTTLNTSTFDNITVVP